MDAAQTLIKFGAIFGLVLALVSTFYWLSIILVRMGFLLVSINIYDALMIGFSLVAIFLCYVIFTRFPQRIEEEPSRSALYLVGLGIVIAVGAWGIAGLLIIIGAILVLIDETS